MEKVAVFGLLSLLIVYFSRRTIFDINAHGFYRFLSWECIAWLLVNNVKYWFTSPYCVRQIFSWIFLFAGLYLVIAGIVLLKKVGSRNKSRDEKSLYAFEKTARLVETGVFRYIRHPMYSSLVFLTWGILLKNPTLPLIAFAVLSTVFLYLTAIRDEKECIRFFGKTYSEYMKRTKRFIPFIF